MYVVVHADGAVMSSIFSTEGRAKSVARYEGDTVVRLPDITNIEPVFIRSKLL